MSETVMTSREFNREPSRAEREASTSPVIIVKGGQPAHVLMSIQEYRRLTQRNESNERNRPILQQIACPEAAEIELPLDNIMEEGRTWPEPADLSDVTEN